MHRYTNNHINIDRHILKNDRLISKCKVSNDHNQDIFIADQLAQTDQSSCRAGSTDIPDPLSPLLPIVSSP